MTTRSHRIAATSDLHPNFSESPYKAARKRPQHWQQLEQEEAQAKASETSEDELLLSPRKRAKRQKLHHIRHNSAPSHIANAAPTSSKGVGSDSAGYTTGAKQTARSQSVPADPLLPSLLLSPHGGGRSRIKPLLIIQGLTPVVEQLSLPVHLPLPPERETTIPTPPASSSAEQSLIGVASEPARPLGTNNQPTTPQTPPSPLTPISDGDDSDIPLLEDQIPRQPSQTQPNLPIRPQPQSRLPRPPPIKPSAPPSQTSKPKRVTSSHKTQPKQDAFQVLMNSSKAQNKGKGKAVDKPVQASKRNGSSKPVTTTEAGLWLEHKQSSKLTASSQSSSAIPAQTLTKKLSIKQRMKKREKPIVRPAFTLPPPLMDDTSDDEHYSPNGIHDKTVDTALGVETRHSVFDAPADESSNHVSVELLSMEQKSDQVASTSSAVQLPVLELQPQTATQDVEMGEIPSITEVTIAKTLADVTTIAEAQTVRDGTATEAAKVSKLAEKLLLLPIVDVPMEVMQSEGAPASELTATFNAQSEHVFFDVAVESEQALTTPTEDNLMLEGNGEIKDAMQEQSQLAEGVYPSAHSIESSKAAEDEAAMDPTPSRDQTSPSNAPVVPQEMLPSTNMELISDIEGPSSQTQSRGKRKKDMLPPTRVTRSSQRNNTTSNGSSESPTSKPKPPSKTPDTIPKPSSSIPKPKHSQKSQDVEKPSKAKTAATALNKNNVKNGNKRAPNSAPNSPSKIGRSSSMFVKPSSGMYPRPNISGASSALSVLSDALERLHAPAPERPSTSMGFNHDGLGDDDEEADKDDNRLNESTDDSILSTSTKRSGIKRLTTFAEINPHSKATTLPAATSSKNKLMQSRLGVSGSNSKLTFGVPGPPMKRGAKPSAFLGRRNLLPNPKASRNPSLPSVQASPRKGDHADNEVEIEEQEQTGPVLSKDDKGKGKEKDGDEDVFMSSPDSLDERGATEVSFRHPGITSSKAKGKQRERPVTQSMSALPSPSSMQSNGQLRSSGTALPKTCIAESTPNSESINDNPRDPSLSNPTSDIPAIPPRPSFALQHALPALPSASDVLKECKIFVDVRNEMGDDASELFVQMLKDMGARLTTRVGQRCTHIVYKNGMASTLNRYRLLREPLPTVVGVGWIVQCVKENAHVDESNYIIDVDVENVVGANHKRRKSFLPKAIFAPPSDPGNSSEADADEPMDNSQASTSIDDDLPPLERARRRKSMLPPPRL